MPIDPGLPPPLAGETRTLTGRAGTLAYTVAGDRGPPLLMIHSINAAANSYEVKPIFEPMAAERRVYAPDLPGFGRSERGDRNYSIALYTAAVEEMLDEVARDRPGEPIDLLALSLSSEFAARALLNRPGRVRSLTLVTPTGFTPMSSEMRGPEGSSREIPLMYAIVSNRLWSQGLFDLLTSKGSIRYFLKRTFGSDRVPEDFVAYDHLAAHRPGARFAPLAFLSGRLFSADVRSLYEQLTLPVWVPHATRGDFKNFTGSAWAQAKGNWRFSPYPTGALPHFETPAEFLAEFREFLTGVGR